MFLLGEFEVGSQLMSRIQKRQLAFVKGFSFCGRLHMDHAELYCVDEVGLGGGRTVQTNDLKIVALIEKVVDW